MTIFQSNDGYLSFGIQANKENDNMFLLSLSDYMSLLNEEDLAQSFINKVGLVSAPDILGTFVDAGSDKFSIISGMEFNPLIYRGQNKDYAFMPTSKRYELSNGNERIRHALNWIKKHEFLNLFKTMSYYNRVQNFKVLNCHYEYDLEAVAQSYNYMSNCLDMTRNLMTAYFFAYVSIDRETGKFMPIEDFETYTPIIYVGNMAEIYAKHPEVISNMSLQLLTRPKMQDTLSLNLESDVDIKYMFKKIELPKNINISRNIFNMFRGGEALFPADYLSRCAIQIRNHKTLQDELINAYCVETSTDQKWLRGELKKLDYEIIDKPWNIPEQARYMVNREIDELIIPYLNSAVAFRGCKKAETAEKNEMSESAEEVTV